MSQQTINMEQLDALNEIQRCFSVIGDLMCQSDDLHVVNRDALAILFGFLSSSIDKAIEFKQLDELQLLQRCFSVIGDLMIPCNDLHVVNRDNLSMLLGHLSAQMDKVMEGE